jgi:hypothetical protein
VRVVPLRLAGPYEGGYRGRSGNMFASSTTVDSALARRRPVASGGGGELGSRELGSLGAAEEPMGRRHAQREMEIKLKIKITIKIRKDHGDLESDAA